MVAPLLTRRSVLLAKVQTAQGTPSTPVNTTDAFLVSDLDYTVDPTLLERQNFRGSLSVDPSVVGRKLASITFTHELKAANSSSAIPKVGDLLRGCGYAETDIAPNLQYDPISTAFEYFTMEAYFDGLKHQITDALGTFTITADAGQFATIAFTFTGNYIAPTDVAVPVGTFEASLPLIVENAAFALSGFADFCVQSLTIDGGNEITPRECINKADGFDGVVQTARNVTGSANPEAVLVGTENVFGKFAAGTTGALTATLGAAADDQIIITAPAVQTTNITYSDRDGLRTWDLALQFAAGSGAGNDELRFTFPQSI